MRRIALGVLLVSSLPAAALVAAAGGATLPAGAARTAVAAASSTQSVPYAMGSNSSGQLGDGTTNDASTAVKMSAPVTFTDVAAGGLHAVALGTDGKVYAWGSNTWGQLGDGTTTDSATPVVVHTPGGVAFTSVSAGTNQSYALSSTGVLYAWGLNTFGQLGNGTNTSSSTPVTVSAPAGVTFSAVSAGGLQTLALGTNHTVYAWGSNSFGQLGDGTTTNRNAPVAVTIPGGATAVAAGGSHSLALASDGNVFAWGQGSSGQLGQGETKPPLDSSSVPLKVDAGAATLPFKAIAAGGLHSVALDAKGNVFTWGDNNLQQLGVGATAVCPDTSSSCSTVPVRPFLPTKQSFVSIAAGYGQTYALSSNGQLWDWGDNFYGQLGIGKTGTMQPAPVHVTTQTGTNAAQIVSGPASSFGFFLTGKDQTITFPTLTKTYGTPPFIPATASSGLPVTLSAVGPPTVCKAEGPALAILSPGACSVTANQPGNNVWNPAPTNKQTITVDKAALTITPDDKTSTVGTIPPLTYTLAPFVNGDTQANSTTGAASCSTPADKTSPAANYPINCAVGSLASGKYTFTPGPPGTLTLLSLPAPYHPLTPFRLLDTRTPTGGHESPLGAGEHLDLQVTGVDGIPETATAVVLNVTATDPTQPSFLTVFPTDAAQPTASNLNFLPNQTVPNLVEVGISQGPATQGQVSIYNDKGDTNVVADVEGYYGPVGATQLYNPLSPVRILDTRNGTGATGPVRQGTPISVQVAGKGGVPSWGGSGRAQRDRGPGHQPVLPHRLAVRGRRAQRLEPQLLAEPDRAQPGHRAPGRQRQDQDRQRRGRDPGDRRRRGLLHRRHG